MKKPFDKQAYEADLRAFVAATDEHNRYRQEAIRNLEAYFADKEKVT